MSHHHHHQATRRGFLRHVGIGSSLVLGLWEDFKSLLGATTEVPEAKYDLLIQGGRVIDPSQDLSADRDVAISAGKVARVAPHMTESARRVLDARGKIVTPGLIDL